MSVSVLHMSMSLDGYIAGPNDEPGNPGGDGFDRLHDWFAPGGGEFVRPPGPAGELLDEWDAAGAILVGRRTAEQIDHWGGDHHGRPIFVVSHRPPGQSVAKYPLVTYVTDGIASAMAQAKAAAGDRNVLVHGGYTAQWALEAGVLDELQIHQIPVLFGGGRRLFEVLPSRIELEIVRVIDTPDATHIRYRVRRRSEEAASPPASSRSDVASVYAGLTKTLQFPAGFHPPTNLRYDDILARAIGRADLRDDVRGINASVELIRRTRGGGWPTDPVSEEYNFVDLVWHELEFREGLSLTYAVYDVGQRYLGCCYLYPMGRRRPLTADLLAYDVDVSWWVTPEAYDEGYYRKLYAALRTWLVDDLPFQRPYFSNVEIPSL